MGRKSGPPSGTLALSHNNDSTPDALRSQRYGSHPRHDHEAGDWIRLIHC